MERFKKILLWLCIPPLPVTVAVTLAAIIGMPIALVLFGEHHPLTYAVYGISAYALLTVCFRIPDMIRLYRYLKYENKYVVRYMSDPHLRVKISLYLSLAINLGFAAFQLGLGIFHRAAWYYSLSGYYVLLSIMRYYLLGDVRRGHIGENILLEHKRYRFIGIMLVIMNVILAGIVMFITIFGRSFKHHFITTIALAAFTFTTASVAIVDVIKYRKYESPVYSASKAISLASAAVSVLTLETAMLTAFGDAEEELFRTVMTSATGTAVCIFVLVIGVVMIVRSTKKIKELRNTESND